MKITRIPRIDDTPNIEHSALAAIRCPVCRRGKLLDAVEEADVSMLHLFSDGQPGRRQWYIKCPKCGSQIGISFGKGSGKSGLRKSLLH